MNHDPFQRKVINSCAWATIAVGVLVCLGWVGNIAVLKSVFPGLSTMKVNTALLFMLSGISLLTVPNGSMKASHRLRLGLTCAAAVAAVACLTLAEYAFLIDLGIDQLFIRDSVNSIATRFPGRMAPVTAWIFLLSSTTLTLIHLNRGPRLAQVLTVLVFLTASLCCLSYLYGAESLHSIAPFSPIAVHSAIAFLIFSMGLLSAMPKMGLVALIAGDGVGGVLIRQLLPIAIIGPVLMGWIRLAGQNVGWYGTEFGLALFALFNIILSSGLVCWTALIVQRSDIRRKLADEAFRASERRFRVIVEASPSGLMLVDQQGRIILANSPMEKLFGYGTNALLGLPVEQLLPERYREHHPAFRSQYFSDPQSRAMGSGRDLWGLRRDGSEFAIEIGLRPVETEHQLFVLTSIIDITYRKEAEQALQLSERRYRVLLEGVPQLVWTCRQDGYCDYLSRQWTDYTGIPQSDHLGRGWLNAIHPDDLADLAERWEFAVRTREPFDGEFRIRSHSGQYRWFKTRAVLISQDDGSEKWFGTNTDIDDQKRAEATLRQAHDQLERRVQERTRQLTELNASLQQEIDIRRSAEARLRERAEEIETLLDVLPVPVWIARDPECREITGNRATYELLGLPHGTNVSKSAPPDERTAFRVFHEGQEIAPEDLPMQRAATMGMVVRNAVLDLAFDDGSFRSVFGFAAPLFDPNERVRGCIGVFIDITERRRLENDLRSSEERFRAVVQDQTEVVCRMRSDGTFLFVNNVYCRTFGKSASELIGTKWVPVAHPDDVPGIVAELSKLSCTCPIVRIENRVYDASGKVRWMEFINRGFFAANGELQEIQSVGRDVTDRRQIETQLRKSLDEKEILLKEIHHRVKNNLQIVSALLDLQSHFTSDPAALQMFQESRGRVKSMALIHERLYTSEDMARVNFSEYIRQLADEIYHIYRISSEVIRLDLDVEIPPMTIDIAIPCGLLLNELISNCFKHAFKNRPNGNVRVSLRRSSDGTNVLIVADNGAGFPPNTDFRNTTSFGLQLVNMLVDQLHGNIEMVTGRGTTFTIRFPKLTP